MIFFLTLLSWICLFLSILFAYKMVREQDTLRKTTRRHLLLVGEEQEYKHSTMRTKITELTWTLAPVGARIQLLSEPAYLEDLLIKSGLEYRWRVEQIHGAKLLSLFAGMIISFLYILLGLPIAHLMVPMLLAGSFLAPISNLKREGNKRQGAIRIALPDFLDMMSVTLMAGMSFDIALAYYTKVTKGPLSEEFSRFLQELQFGIDRETAYRAMQRRITVRELHGLTQTLIQVHRLGSPVAHVFAEQARQMRGLRTEKAKEAAGKAAPRISLISGLVIAPSIFLFVLGIVLLKSFLSPDSPIQMFFGS
jgi:tight adherence protein C